MTNKTCNGWTNYETWAANIYFDDFFTEQAKECWDEASPCGYFSRAENASMELRKIIETTIEELTLESLGDDKGLASDLVRAGLSEINYGEIAKNYLSELEE